MKCFYHPDKDAVGICSQCGKGCCRACVEDVGGALLCKDCRTLSQTEVTKKLESEKIRAKRVISRSWIVAAILSLIFIPTIFINQKNIWVDLAAIILIPYDMWGIYWGWGVVWPAWKKLFSGVGCFTVWWAWIIIIVLFFYIPLALAQLYGTFGGGVYQYLKYRKIAQGEG
jgi:hypothetical protein